MNELQKKKNAVINIAAVYNDGENNDTVEITTQGTVEETDAAWAIKYTEIDEINDGKVDVEVQIKKDLSCVENIRSGGYTSNMLIETARRNVCHYATPHGDILMGILGKAIDFKLDENGNARLELEYTIDINGSIASTNELKIDAVLS